MTAFTRLLRSYAGHPLAVRLLYFALRRGLPLPRLFKPLFGATALVSLTYRCQCACRHCGIGLFKKEGAEELSTEEVRTLLRDLRAAGGSGVHFFGGEPLLVPDLVGHIREATRLGLRSSIETNGLLLDQAMAAALAEAGIESVKVSLDSPEESEHDKFRASPGAWRKASAALKYCREAGIRTVVNYYASREAIEAGEIERMTALARELGARLRLLPPVRAGLWKDREDIPLSAKEVDLLRSRLKPGEACWGYDFLDRPGAPYRCHSLLQSTFDVSAYGDILSCPYVPVSFGSIRREPLAQAVARMWKANLFGPESQFDGCPLNASSFQARYDSVLKGGSR